MQHSLLRNKNETVKLFSHKDPSRVLKSLEVYKFNQYGLSDITPQYNITNLNEGYYSTEITTPDEQCYLLILFCGNPIVLRIEKPPVQFFFWSPRNNIERYKHYSEDGILVSEGSLKLLNYGFSYYTPEEETLGYIEVRNKPYVLNIPYGVKYAGIGINVDWRRTIIRQDFGVLSIKRVFELNIIKNSFKKIVRKNEFSLKTRYNSFDIDTIKQKFKVSCKGV
ncbi:MAG: hypothetical protein KAI79_14210 [Bacteroidales bacterium]|nr:hypothetical protein [Bacteroidales bacterium]